MAYFVSVMNRKKLLLILPFGTYFVFSAIKEGL